MIKYENNFCAVEYYKAITQWKLLPRSGKSEETKFQSFNRSTPCNFVRKLELLRVLNDRGSRYAPIKYRVLRSLVIASSLKEASLSLRDPGATIMISAFRSSRRGHWKYVAWCAQRMLRDRVRGKTAGIWSDAALTVSRLPLEGRWRDVRPSTARSSGLWSGHDRKPSCLPLAASMASDWIKEVRWE